MLVEKGQTKTVRIMCNYLIYKELYVYIYNGRILLFPVFRLEPALHSNLVSRSLGCVYFSFLSSQALLPTGLHDGMNGGSVRADFGCMSTVAFSTPNQYCVELDRDPRSPRPTMSQ